MKKKCHCKINYDNNGVHFSKKSMKIMPQTLYSNSQGLWLVGGGVQLH